MKTFEKRNGVAILFTFPHNCQTVVEQTYGKYHFRMLETMTHDLDLDLRSSIFTTWSPKLLRPQKIINKIFYFFGKDIKLCLNDSENMFHHKNVK